MNFMAIPISLDIMSWQNTAFFYTQKKGKHF